MRWIDEPPDVTDPNEPDYEEWERQKAERMADEMDALLDAKKYEGLGL